VSTSFLAGFARSGDFVRDAPLRGRLPLWLALDFFLLFPMGCGAEGAFIDGIASGAGRASCRACHGLYFCALLQTDQATGGRIP